MIILVCPLNWGLGHATRCIPLIRQLTGQGHHVIIGASGRPLALLRKEFPNLHAFDFPDYSISCPRGSSLIPRLIFRTPQILMLVKRERRKLEDIIKEFQVQVVISDNRYGLWSANVRSILITHQLMLKLPAGLAFAESMVHRSLKKMISHFNEVWVPDQAGSVNLSGDLSHKYPVSAPTRFIGWMSRFNTMKINGDQISETSPAYVILAVISGPEPQRSHFEDLLRQQMRNSGLKCCILQGKPDEPEQMTHDGNIDLISHTGDENLLQLVKRSGLLICRPGYSTLMDLVCWKRKAILIPTPGQSEQEYLALHLCRNKWFLSCRQSEFDLQMAMSANEGYSGFPDAMLSQAFFTLPEEPAFPGIEKNI
jgi:uncharacterized protein (TIGR00661 family)